jgi:hypothetical protein
MIARGEKLGEEPRIDQSMGWGCSQESQFLRSSGIHPTLLGQCERFSRTAYRERVCAVCIKFLLHDVHRFELP